MRSGREHWAWMVVVEIRRRRTRRTRRRRKEGTKEGRKEDGADIKSNNPHLTGGEKQGNSRKCD